MILRKTNDYQQSTFIVSMFFSYFNNNKLENAWKHWHRYVASVMFLCSACFIFAPIEQMTFLNIHPAFLCGSVFLLNSFNTFEQVLYKADYCCEKNQSKQVIMHTPTYYKLTQKITVTHFLHQRHEENILSSHKASNYICIVCVITFLSALGQRCLQLSSLSYYCKC